MTLLTNAVAELKGQGRLCLRVQATESWVEARIEACDDTRAPAVTPPVCEPGIHCRADRMASGLGLFGAYHLVRRHGGELAVDSKPDVGLVFAVRLPLSPDGPSKDRPAAAP